MAFWFFGPDAAHRWGRSLLFGLFLSVMAMVVGMLLVDGINPCPVLCSLFHSQGWGRAGWVRITDAVTRARRASFLTRGVWFIGSRAVTAGRIGFVVALGRVWLIDPHESPA